MKYVRSVHFGQSHGHFIKSVPAKVFGEVFMVLCHYAFHRSLIHKLKNDENFLVEVEELMALDHLVTIQVGDETSLFHDHVQVLLV